MSDFVWIIDANMESLLGAGGVSSSYIIPKDKMNGEEGEISGRRLWIILRAEEDRFLGSIMVRHVEIIQEGYYRDDFLVTCDLLSSFRLCANYSAARDFIASGIAVNPLGVSPISHDKSESLKAILGRRIQVRLTRPSKSTFDNIHRSALPMSPRAMARTAVSIIVKSFSFSDIWASGFGDKQAAFGFFAKCFLEFRGIDTSSISDEFSVYDPIINVICSGKSNSGFSSSARFDRNFNPVSLDFSEIIPEKVFARKFVSSRNCLDSSSQMEKTEAAEGVHQFMMKDISRFLLSQGIVPFESSSIDIIYWVGNKTKLLEIKSATSENIISQAAKGAFQIACYTNSLKNEYPDICSSLILEKIVDKQLEIYVRSALERLGIKCFVYDEDADWPIRVDGLLVC